MSGGEKWKQETGGGGLHRQIRGSVPDKVLFMQRHVWHKDHVFMWGKKP